MTPHQKNTLIGMILGDAYLQKTGKQNARLRLEQSSSQKEYLIWKREVFKDFFQDKIKTLTRTNPKWQKTYEYVRCQSYSSPEFGAFRKLFYNDSIKIIPSTIKTIFNSPLSLAVWFMDDGYYYHRDKMAYIYISNFDDLSCANLISCLKDNFNLAPQLKKKKKGLVLTFSVRETQKLMELIKPFMIPSMSYKIPLNPVSTEGNPELFSGKY